MPDNERPPRPSAPDQPSEQASSAPEDQSAGSAPEDQPAGSDSEELTAEERARLSEEALRLLGGGTPLSREELAEDPYINYRQ